jgi:hypothetical protein
MLRIPLAQTWQNNKQISKIEQKIKIKNTTKHHRQPKREACAHPGRQRVFVDFVIGHVVPQGAGCQGKPAKT